MIIVTFYHHSQTSEIGFSYNTALLLLTKDGGDELSYMFQQHRPRAARHVLTLRLAKTAYLLDGPKSSKPNISRTPIELP